MIIIRVDGIHIPDGDTTAQKAGHVETCREGLRRDGEGDYCEGVRVHGSMDVGVGFVYL
jgi:hypothetical protein